MQTLLDSSRRNQLSEISDIELSKNEDSVTTLAVASSSEQALTAIAGINSSAEDQSAGKNEHLRSFRVPLPPRKRKADGTLVELSEKSAHRPTATQALGKTALFKSAHDSKSDLYQRVLRASPIKSSNEARLAVIASGLAPENEIIAFQPVSNARSSTVDEISRISLGKIEAEDVDVIPVKRVGHLLAYCTSKSVFIQQLPNTKGSKIEEPVKVYETTSSQATFRALRLLTPKHVLLLQNLPSGAGAELLVLHIDQGNSSGRITLQKRLSKVKKAVGFDTCALSDNPSGEKQFVIAISDNTASIEILTIEYTPSTGLKTFQPCTVLRSVHPGLLTRLTFSNFIGPSLPVSKDTLPQSIRLASVSVEGTIVVHTLHLSPYPPEKNENPRYVLNVPGSSVAAQNTFSIFMAILIIGFASFLLQATLEIKGAVPPTLGTPNWLSPGWRDTLYKPYSVLANETTAETIPQAVSDAINAINPSSDTMPSALSSAIDAIKSAPSHITIPSVDQAQARLADLVSSNTQLETPKSIIVRDTGADLSTELHHDVDLVKEETLKKWEDLSEKQRTGWKQKLIDAGHWVEGQGETVLKGVLFGELAGVVAAGVREL